jgi:CheY-like chemotaxis protein/GGDEF domain-containing protein
VAPKARILAVDDQVYFRTHLEEILAGAGYAVVTASSGPEALTRMAREGPFDVVLTDLVMPEMDGNELVNRVKQRNPDQDIVVVTGIVDVKTAVDSIKLGASEYLLKPFDRETLASTLEGVLHRRRLRAEHAKLLTENIQYLGERTLIERATALFSILTVERLADRIVDGLCIETGAQGGVMWIADAAGQDRLVLAAARGLVRVEDEPEAVEGVDIPSEFSEAAVHSTVMDWGAGDGGEQTALYLALRSESRIVGLLRLTDKLGGEDFDPIDRSCAETFVEFAQTALCNALRFRELERKSLEDTATGVCSFEYFHNAVRNEIEKATRHGRGFSILKLDISPIDGLRRERGEAGFREWMNGVVEHLSQLQRSSDLLSADGEGGFLALLPEADALGAWMLKRRAAEALEFSGLLTDIEPRDRPPQVHFAVASYPSDATQMESLLRLLDERIESDRSSPLNQLGLQQQSLSACLEKLLERGVEERPGIVAQIAQFVIAEPARRPESRSLLFTAPGEILGAAIGSGLEKLRGVSTQTEISVLAGGRKPDTENCEIHWLTNPGQGVLPPFLIYLGEGPAYALVCEDGPGREGTRLFQTSDRGLVEHLALRVQHDLRA